MWREICLLLLFVLTDFSTSTEFTFWNYKTIKELSISQTKYNHSDSPVSESDIFVFAHAGLGDHFQKDKRNGEVLKIWKVLQERKLLPNRDWTIKIYWKEE